MNIDSHAPGSLAWVSLRTPDATTAAAFYRAVLGWELDGSTGSDAPATARVKGRPVGSIAAVGRPPLAGWTAYLAVVDADESARAVAAAGGAVLVPPREVAGAGREAVLADPSGARFGIWQAGARRGTGLVDEPGAFSWAELITDDVEDSVRFYAAVFGWTVTEPSGPLGRREWLLDGHPVAGLLPRPPAMAADVPPYWDVYFTVADAAATAAIATGDGATQLMPPTDIGPARIAVFLDPAGSVFTVAAPTR